MWWIHFPNLDWQPCCPPAPSTCFHLLLHSFITHCTCSFYLQCFLQCMLSYSICVHNLRKCEYENSKSVLVCVCVLDNWVGLLCMKPETRLWRGEVILEYSLRCQVCECECVCVCMCAYESKRNIRSCLQQCSCLWLMCMAKQELHRVYNCVTDAERFATCMSLCMLVCILQYVQNDSEWRAGMVVMLRQLAKKMETHFNGRPNHSTHNNKVWDHFCKRKWFGASKWVWKHSWMPMFMSEGHMEENLSAERTDLQPDNRWCRDVQLRYFPSADPKLSVVVHVYIIKY